MQDLHNNIKCVRAISPTRVTDNTAQVSQIIDKAGFDAVEFVIAAGTLADADATFTVLLEEGNNSALSDNTTVAAADCLGTQAGASFVFSDDDKVLKLGYIGSKRYTRLTITPAANTGNADISCVAILGHAAKGPQSTQKN